MLNPTTINMIIMHTHKNIFSCSSNAITIPTAIQNIIKPIILQHIITARIYLLYIQYMPLPKNHYFLYAAILDLFHIIGHIINSFINIWICLYLSKFAGNSVNNIWNHINHFCYGILIFDINQFCSTILNY